MGERKIRTREMKEYVDKCTGEVKEVEVSKVITINIGRQEEFYMTYCRYMAPMYELTYADDLKLLIKMCELAEYEKGTVFLTQQRRSDILVELGMHTANMSKSLKRLKEKNLITGDRGEYTINHLIFWKGDRSKRLELLRNNGLTATFNFKLEE